MCVCTYVFPSWRQSTAGQQLAPWLFLSHWYARVHLASNLPVGRAYSIAQWKTSLCVCFGLHCICVYMFGYADVCLSDDITVQPTRGMRGSFSLIAMLPHSQTTVVIVLFVSFSFSLSFLWTKYFFLWKRKDNLKRKEKRQGLNVDVSGHITGPDKPNWREKMKRLRVEYVSYYTSRHGFARTQLCPPTFISSWRVLYIIYCTVHSIVKYTMCILHRLFVSLSCFFHFFFSFRCSCSGSFFHIYKIVFLSSSKRRRRWMHTACNHKVHWFLSVITMMQNRNRREAEAGHYMKVEDIFSQSQLYKY